MPIPIEIVAFFVNVNTIKIVRSEATILKLIVFATVLLCFSFIFIPSIFSHKIPNTNLVLVDRIRESEGERKRGGDSALRKSDDSS